MSWLNRIIDVSKKAQQKSVKKVSKEERTKRLEFCKACPKLADTGQCTKCGCFVVSKTWYEDDACPLGKW
jgi:hypothetical protein